jgi:hypothetical protein
MSKPLRERLKEAASFTENARRARRMTVHHSLGITLFETIVRIAANGFVAIAQRLKTTCLGNSRPKSRHSTSSASQNVWTSSLSTKVWAMSL